MRKPHARAMHSLIALQKRESVNPDAPHDYGNTRGEWVDQFQAWAQAIHLRGGEAVLAARLEGRHTQVFRVRATSLAREVDTDWRIVEVRDATGNPVMFGPDAVEYGDIPVTYGTVTVGHGFNIRDVSPSDDRRWLDLLCERGGAT